MKKLLIWVVLLAMMLTMCTIPSIAATSTKMTTAETNIVKAYVKTLETGDLQYLNKYKYPGVKFKIADYDSDIIVKILTPKYSKSYDSKKKLYKLMVKGLLVITDGEQLAYCNLECGLYIKTKSNKQYAYAEVDNTKDTQFLEIDDLSDSTVTALERYLTSLYDEDTAYALMYPDEEDEDEDEGEDADFYEDGEEADDDDSDVGNNGSTSSKADATLKNPVALNETFTWSENKDFLKDKISGTYSVTINSVKKISRDDVANLGFRKPQDDDKVEYALVDVTYEVKNATLKKGSGDGWAYLNVGWDIDIWGIKTPAGDSIIGATDYGFDGSLSRAMDEVTNLKKIYPGDTESFKATGKVLMTLYKGKTNYLVIRNETIDDYYSSFMYFSLE